MDAIAEIKKIYYAATKQTIQKDLYRAIDLLKTLPTEEDRDKVAVYMDGLAQMRAEWGAAARPKAGPAAGGATSGSRRRASAPRPEPPQERSDPSKSSSRRRR